MSISTFPPNPNVYKSPILSTEPFTILSFVNLFSNKLNEIVWFDYANLESGGITVKYTDGETVEFNGNVDTQYTPKNGIFKLIYNGTLRIYLNPDTSSPSSSGSDYPVDINMYYTIYAVSNVDPLPKWNARTVIERALAIAETIREGDTPRFTLNAEQAALFENIETPEFQFTQSTLREILQGVGSYVHGEPRLRGTEIYYDMYGGNEVNAVPIEPYASLSVQQDIEQYCTSIDSSVDNLVNTLDYAKGILIEPYNSGYKTLRTETLYYMLTEDNAEISTQKPINEIIKVECGFVGSATPPIDITAFVYEEANYTRLSSYSDVYPASRAYAIYYTQGENNIKGLFFKQENPIAPAFENYAILNILRAATGNNSLTIDNLQLAFRVTYRPIFSARVKQSKSYLLSVSSPRAKSYTQGQNLIETTYYGEHLKGVVARLGNISKTITYVRPGLPELPKVGTLYNDGDDDYYISVVSAEFFPFVTKVTIGLSQDFNRYSEFVGINSMKRMYEVSEKQAFDSHITYNDYVVFGDQTGNNDALYNKTAIVNIFSQNYTYSPVTLLIAQGYDASNNALPAIALPVMTASMGNAALMVANYKDNYSAGDNLTYQNYTPAGGGANVDGYFVNSVAYSDVYGNIEYLSLNYYSDGTAPTSATEQSTIGNSLPSAENVTGTGQAQISTDNNPLWVKKGSTEVPTIDYQIDFVSNRKNIIIGSGLAQNCTLISGTQTGHGAVLYVLPYRLNKFDLIVDLTNATQIYDYNNGGGLYLTGNGFQFEPQTSPVSGQSWVMVDKATNALLVGCNTQITTDMTDILNGLFVSCTHKF